MQIDIEKLDNLIADAANVLIKPEAEEVIIQLLDIQEQVETAIKEAKKRIEEAALRINPNFKSLKADKIKVYYRQYGSKYRIDESLIDQVPTSLYKTKKVYSVISKEVDAWTAEHDGMPIGIIETEREKSIAFSKRDKDTYESEDE